MAAEISADLSLIQDEDVLRRMWADTEDFGRKKEIRARMYKLREQRLRDFYTTGEVVSEMAGRKHTTTTHTESIGDQGFLTMKSKEIRDSESPTRDLSRRGENNYWNTSKESSYTTANEGGALVETRSTSEDLHGSRVEGNTQSQISMATQNVHETSSKSDDNMSCKSEAQSQNSRLVTSTRTQDDSANRMASSSHQQQSSSQYKTEQQTSSNSHMTTTKWSSSTSSSSAKRIVSSSSHQIISGDDNALYDTRAITSGDAVDSRSTYDSRFNDAYSTNDRNVSQDYQSSETVRNKYTTQDTNVHNTSPVQNTRCDTTDYDTLTNVRRFVDNEKDQSTYIDKTDIHRTDTRDYTTQAHAKDYENRNVQNIITSDERSYETDNRDYQVQRIKDQLSQTNRTSDTRSNYDYDNRDAQKTVTVDRRTTTERDDRDIRKKTTDIRTTESDTTNIVTDQKIMSEIQKLDSYLSSQNTPGASTPVSPHSVSDASSWTIVSNTDGEFVYQADKIPEGKTPPTPDNSARATPVKHPSTLELPKDTTESQYITTYQHTFTRISVDNSPTHEYFAKTLRASPDRSTPPPTKRTSSKGSLDRSSPERKFRGSPSRKTPDKERRVSIGSYTVEKSQDTKRKTSDNSRYSTITNKETTKTKRKLSSTQAKTANKTRVATPGASPSTSPTRSTRPRPASSSDSDSETSQRTHDKATTPSKDKVTDVTNQVCIDENLKKDVKVTKISTETKIEDKYATYDKRKKSDHSRIDSDTTKITKPDQRKSPSPSIKRPIPREKSPEYSSEGSVSRELKSVRSPGKTYHDSSPERSVFQPIKTIHVTTQKDQTSQMIHEEQKHITKTISTESVEKKEPHDDVTTERPYEPTTQKKLPSSSKEPRSSSISPYTSPDRTSKVRSYSPTSRDTPDRVDEAFESPDMHKRPELASPTDQTIQPVRRPVEYDSPVPNAGLERPGKKQPFSSPRTSPERETQNKLPITTRPEQCPGEEAPSPYGDKPKSKSSPSPSPDRTMQTKITEVTERLVTKTTETSKRSPERTLKKVPPSISPERTLKKTSPSPKQSPERSLRKGEPSPSISPDRTTKKSSPSPQRSPDRVTMKTSPSPQRSPERVTKRSSPSPQRSPERITKKTSPPLQRSPERVTKKSSPSPQRSPDRVTKKASSSPQRSPERVTKKSSPSPQRSPDRVTKKTSPSPQRSPERVTKKSSPSPQRSPERVTKKTSPSPQRSPERVTKKTSLSPQRSPERITKKSSPSPQRSPERITKKSSPSPQHSPERVPKKTSPSPQRSPEKTAKKISPSPTRSPDRTTMKKSLPSPARSPDRIPKKSSPSALHSPERSPKKTVPTVSRSPERTTKKILPSPSQSPERTTNKISPSKPDAPEGIKRERTPIPLDTSADRDTRKSTFTTSPTKIPETTEHYPDIDFEDRSPTASPDEPPSQTEEPFRVDVTEPEDTSPYSSPEISPVKKETIPLTSPTSPSNRDTKKEIPKSSPERPIKKREPGIPVATTERVTKKPVSAVSPERTPQRRTPYKPESKDKPVKQKPSDHVETTFKPKRLTDTSKSTTFKTNERYTTQRITDKRISETTDQKDINRLTRMSNIPRAETKSSPKTPKENVQPKSITRISTPKDRHPVDKRPQTRYTSPHTRTDIVTKSVMTITSSKTLEKPKQTPVRKPTPAITKISSQVKKPDDTTARSKIPVERKPRTPESHAKTPTMRTPSKADEVPKKPKTPTTGKIEKIKTTKYIDETEDYDYSSPNEDEPIESIEVTIMETDDTVDNATLHRNIDLTNVSTVIRKSVVSKTDFIENEKYTLENQNIEDENPPDEFYADVDDEPTPVTTKELIRGDVNVVNKITRNLTHDNQTVRKVTQKQETDVSRTRQVKSSPKLSPTKPQMLKPSESKIPTQPKQSRPKATPQTTKLAPEKKPSKIDKSPQKFDQSPRATTKRIPKQRKDSSSSSSSEDEDETMVIKQDVETSVNERHYIEEVEVIIKSDEEEDLKETITQDKLTVVVQHPKSSRESSPDYPNRGVPFSATSDDGESIPRYADYISEPEDVEIFDYSRLGPRKPIPCSEDKSDQITDLDDETETQIKLDVSVADRVSKFMETTRKKSETVPQDHSPVSAASPASVRKAKAMFENIAKNQTSPSAPTKKKIDIYDSPQEPTRKPSAPKTRPETTEEEYMTETDVSTHRKVDICESEIGEVTRVTQHTSRTTEEVYTGRPSSPEQFEDEPEEPFELEPVRKVSKTPREVERSEKSPSPQRELPVQTSQKPKDRNEPEDSLPKKPLERNQSGISPGDISSKKAFFERKVKDAEKPKEKPTVKKDFPQNKMSTQPKQKVYPIDKDFSPKDETRKISSTVKDTKTFLQREVTETSTRVSATREEIIDDEEVTDFVRTESPNRAKSYRQSPVRDRAPSCSPRESPERSPVRKSKQEPSPERNYPRKESVERKSPERTYPRKEYGSRASPERTYPRKETVDRKSPERTYPRKDSVERRSPERTYPRKEYVERKSPERTYPRMETVDRRSPERTYPKKESVERRSPERRYPRKESVDRKSPERTYPRKESVERNSPERSYPRRETVDKKSPERTYPRKESVERRSPERTYPRKETVDRKSPERAYPRKELDDTKSPERTYPRKESIERKSPERTYPRKESVDRKSPERTYPRKESVDRKSPERTHQRKESLDHKSPERSPLKTKDVNVIKKDTQSPDMNRVGGKFGVTLRRTPSSSNQVPSPSTRRPSAPGDEPEIEDILQLELLEEMLLKAVAYDERRRIRAQIRVVKRQMEETINAHTTIQKTTKTFTPTSTAKQPQQKPYETVSERRPSPTRKEPNSSARKITNESVERRVETVVTETTEPLHTYEVHEVVRREEEEEITETGRRRTSPERGVEPVRSFRRQSPEKVVDKKRSTHRPFGKEESPERQAGLNRKETTSPERKRPAYRRPSGEEPDRSPDRRRSKTPEDRRQRRDIESVTSFRTRTSPEKSPTRKTSTDLESHQHTDHVKHGIDSRTSYEAVTTVRSQTTRKASSTEVKETCPTDSITSSYGVGPTDENGRPLFGLKALRRTNTNKTLTDETDNIVKEEKTTVEEDREICDANGRPLFGLKALQTTEDAMPAQPSTQLKELVEKHQQFVLRETSTTESQPRQKPKAKLRDSFISQSQDEDILAAVSSSVDDTHSNRGLSLRSIIQKHEDISSPSTSVKHEMKSSSTSTVVKSVMSSDGKISVTKEVVKGELLSKNGEEPSGKITRSQYTYQTPDEKQSPPSITSTTTTSIIGQRRRSSGPKIFEIEDNSSEYDKTSRRYSKEYTVEEDDSSSSKVVTKKSSTINETESSAQRFTQNVEDDWKKTEKLTSTSVRQDMGPKITDVTDDTDNTVSKSSSEKVKIVRKFINEESAASDQSSSRKKTVKDEDEKVGSMKKTIIRGDSVRALQHKFQQATEAANQPRSRAYPPAGLILRSNSLQPNDDEEDTTSSTSRQSSEKSESKSRFQETRTRETKSASPVVTTKVSTQQDSRSVTSVSKSPVEVQSETTIKTVKTSSQSGASFLDNTTKVTGVQDVLTRMRNANLVVESEDTAEDTEARALLNKFLGASVILQGMEQGMRAQEAAGSPSSATLVSQAEKQRVMATTTTRTLEDIDNITDEKQLRILLEACSDYEGRRKIRARLRTIMADQKASGDEATLTGSEGGGTQRQEIVETKQVETKTDGDSRTRTEVHTRTSSSTARLTKANSVQSPFAKFRQLERQNSAPSVGRGAPIFKFTDPKLVRSASTIKERLLNWVQAQTREYKNIQIDNFSTSWSSGLAFCALIHHFYPDAFDYDSLTPEKRRYNFELAFRVADEKAGIAPLLDVEDMVTMRKPDWKCVFTYVQSVYRRLHDTPEANRY